MQAEVSDPRISVGDISVEDNIIRRVKKKKNAIGSVLGLSQWSNAVLQNKTTVARTHKLGNRIPLNRIT